MEWKISVIVRGRVWFSMTGVRAAQDSGRALPGRKVGIAEGAGQIAARSADENGGSARVKTLSLDGMEDFRDAEGSGLVFHDWGPGCLMLRKRLWKSAHGAFRTIITLATRERPGKAFRLFTLGKGGENPCRMIPSKNPKGT